MDDILSIILFGSIVPAVSYLIKILVIDNVFNYTKNEILLKSKEGKEFRYIVGLNESNEDIRKLFEDELKFEKLVEKNLYRFIKSHNLVDYHLTEGKRLDFLLSVNDRKIGIEAKSNVEHFKTKWVSSYFKENNDIDELIMIVNSKIPNDFMDEINKAEGSKVKFISSSNNRGLTKSINNILELDLGLRG